MILTFVQANHNLKNVWMKEVGNKKKKRITVIAVISKITLDIIGLVNSLKTIYNISEKLLAEQKNSPVRETNLLPLLTKANDNLPVDKQLTHNELVSQIMILLIAGYETTSITLS
ncbi:36095_t:CDS:2 [Racocetra persica]|uniref:36095_t:CDS:1 n=1 Tax=Racocetra persica TaxID=160502 RepID=A0ACA9L7R4_9GLOM|nr:36095_t:CDS:2 [Racocetra persica]